MFLLLLHLEEGSGTGICKKRPGMLLSTLQCTGRSHKQNTQLQSVNSEVGNHDLKQKILPASPTHTHRALGYLSSPLTFLTANLEPGQAGTYGACSVNEEGHVAVK